MFNVGDVVVSSRRMTVANVCGDVITCVYSEDGDIHEATFKQSDLLPVSQDARLQVARWMLEHGYEITDLATLADAMDRLERKASERGAKFAADQIRLYGIDNPWVLKHVLGQ